MNYTNQYLNNIESYAFDLLFLGHYVPQLAEVIYDRNKKVQGDSRINLKGFMVYTMSNKRFLWHSETMFLAIEVNVIRGIRLVAAFADW